MVLLHTPQPVQLSAPDLAAVEELWAKLDAQNLRPEIVHGRLVLEPMPSKKHNIVVSRLIKQLMAVVMENDWEFYSNWDVHIPPERGDRRCPDLMIAPEDPRTYDDNQVFGESVLLAVEVVSASSIEDDYISKPGEYARAGVPLYLIADPLQVPCRIALLFDPAPIDRERDACEYLRTIEVKVGEPLELPEPFGVTLDTAALFR